MKILVITPVFPYPPNDGDRIRIYRLLEQLSKKHSIHIVSFARRGEEGRAGRLKKISRDITAVPVTGVEIAVNAVKALFGSRPLNTAAYDSKRMRDAVDAAVDRVNPDIIFAYRLRTAQFAEGKNIPKVIDIVDSMALFNARRMEYEKNLLRLVYSAIDAPRLLEYETGLESKFSHVFINSEEDAEYLGIKNIITVRNGSDGKFRPPAVKRGEFTAGFFGNMDYAPNMDGLMHFYKKVWKKPAVSDNNIKLAVVGDRRGALAGINAGNVEVKGFIGNIDDEIIKWDAVIVPVRYGAGRQNKIMKAWSCGVPVIASPFAAKGVYGKDGYNLLVAGNAGEFMDGILRLKRDRALGKKLAAGGLKTVKKYFDWERSGNVVEKILRKDAGRAK
jgi:polysaccharide biosynthesis protein PslH